MKRIPFTILSLILIGIPLLVNGQSDSLTSGKKEERIKTGWNIGCVPAIAYDSDIGFKYGGVVEFFHYGDGSLYPKYRHHLYFEWSRTTKGSGINQFTYDSEHLIPGIRITAEASHLTEKALDFYGFNGYESYYNADYIDDENEDYISRMYYRLDRKLTRFKSDFQGKITGPDFRWFAGIAYNHIQIGTVDIDKLNEGKDESELLPDTALLYDQYVDWGFIKSDEADGGNTTLLKAGVIYDTRDVEANPMKGIWTDIQFLVAPSFLGNGDKSYSRMALTHRQYFTLAPKVLSFAYRISWQTKLSGSMPYYMLPFVYNTAPALTRGGIGGSKTIRGISRNRVVGEGFIYGNLELRWKFIRTVILNQNITLVLSGFLDGGRITDPYDFPETTNTDATTYLEKGSDEKFHFGTGAGFHFVMNENFVVAIDYGKALNENDGNSGLYIGFGFLY